MTPAEILLMVQILAGLVGATNGLITLVTTIQKDPKAESIGAELLAAIKSGATAEAMTALKAANAELHSCALELISGSAT